MISTTAVTVTVGKKTAIAGGKGQFFFFLLMHPDKPLLLMIVWYFKGFFQMCVLRDGKPICDGRAHHSELHGQAEAIWIQSACVRLTFVCLASSLC